MSELQQIANFELLEKIGQGGMGSVYKARQVTMQRIVAVKILPSNFAKQPAFIERFMREARASAKLNHPNIVNGIDVGEEKGIYYFAMEYVEGPTLKALIKESPVREGRALEISAAVAEALAHAHAQGIIHRDIKPDNIIIEPNGTPKLCDLGLARSEDEDKEEKSTTRHGKALGTPHYISPEQASGKRDLDAKVDLYALGATLYHMLTGETMFQASSSAAIMSKHIAEKAVNPSDLGVRNKHLVAILAKLLAKDRTDRYASADKLVKDLRLVQAGKPPLSADLPASKSPFKPASKALIAPETPPKKNAPVAAVAPMDKTRFSRRVVRSRGRGAVLLASLVSLIGAVAVLLFLANGAGTKRTKTEPRPNGSAPPRPEIKLNQAPTPRAASTSVPPAVPTPEPASPPAEPAPLPPAVPTTPPANADAGISPAPAEVLPLPAPQPPTPAKTADPKVELKQGPTPDAAAPLSEKDMAGKAPAAELEAKKTQPEPALQTAQKLAPDADGQYPPEAWKQALNLMPLVDVKKDSLHGVFKLQNDTLVSERTKPAVLRIPYRPPEEYDFRIVFTRTHGNCEVVQILSAGARSFSWMMGGWENTIFGFERVNGADASKNATTVKSDMCLENNRQYTAVVQVRKNSVAAYLDGKLIRRWETNYSNARLSEQLRLRDEGVLGVASWDALVIFHGLDLLEITGRGSPTR